MTKGLKSKWKKVAKDYPVIDNKHAVDLIHTMIGDRDDAAHTVPKVLADITDPVKLAALLREAFGFTDTDSEPLCQIAAAIVQAEQAPSALSAKSKKGKMRNT